VVVLPSTGRLSADLDEAGVEVILRPQLSVLRRELASAGGAALLARRTAADAAALRTLIRDRQVALVHSNTSVLLGGAAAARAGRVPHIWHVREIYSRFGRAWPAHRQVLLRGARLLPCVSAATAAQFGEASQVRVVPDGLAAPARRAPQAQARAALGLPDRRVPVVAVLGRISDWKGQDQLVRALATPRLRDRGVVGLLAGSVWPGAEERQERVLELARELGVRDRLVLSGFRDDTESVLGAADVVAVPSTAPDPLPNAALEAAAAGCAVVAAAHGGLPEILRDGETGRLVAPGDPDALAETIAELVDSPSERERLGAAAAADVRERFAPEKLLSAIEALYAEVAEPAAAPRG
jgi:glycosyltransferase involved in cell wall biosynthesis